MEKGLLRIEQAAEVLSLGRSKTYELVQRGELPVIKIGKSARIPVASLQRWIEQRTAEAEAALPQVA